MLQNTVSRRFFGARACVSALGASLAAIGGTTLADTMPNACPVDGCEIEIVAVKRSGNELTLTLEANFSPDISKNHTHVWWGENFTIKQVSNDAETRHKVKQGDWHPTDDYPTYTTQSESSTSARGSARTICVSAADRNHDIIDTDVVHCVDVSSHL